MTMQVPIPDDWDGETFCRWAVCWPNSPKWYAILDGLLSSPSRGRYWDIETGNIKDTQASFLPAYEANFILSEVIMACNDPGIADALNAIAVSINNLALAQGDTIVNAGSGCCDDPTVIVNNTVQTYVTQPVGGNTIPLYGSEPPLEITEGEFPEGYPDFPTYDADKCRKAYAIVSGIAQTCHSLSTITNFETVALVGFIGLALAGAIIFPPADIPLLVAGLLILVGEAHVFEDVGDYIDAHIDEWACILYEGDSVDSIIGLLADAIDLLIAFIAVSGPIGTGIKTCLLLLINSNTINQLFSTAGQNFYPDADCSTCGGCETQELCFIADTSVDDRECDLAGDHGTGDLTLDGTIRTLSSGPVFAGNAYIQFGIPGTSSECTCPFWFEIVETPGGVSWTINQNCSHSGIDHTFEIGNSGHSSTLTFISSSEFTLDIRLDVNQES